MVAVLAMIAGVVAAYSAFVSTHKRKVKARIKLHLLELHYSPTIVGFVDSVKVEFFLENRGTMRSAIRSLEVFVIGTPSDGACVEPERRVLSLRYKDASIEGESIQRVEYNIALPKPDNVSSWKMAYAKVYLTPGGVIESPYCRLYVPLTESIYLHVKRLID